MNELEAKEKMADRRARADAKSQAVIALSEEALAMVGTSGNFVAYRNFQNLAADRKKRIAELKAAHGFDEDEKGQYNELGEAAAGKSGRQEGRR